MRKKSRRRVSGGLDCFAAQALSPPASALPGMLVAFVVGAGVLLLVFVPVAEAALVAAVGVFVAPTRVRVEGFTRVPVAAGGVGAIARAPVAGYVAASEAVVVPIPVAVVVAVPVAILIAPAVPVAVVVPILRYRDATEEQRRQHSQTCDAVLVKHCVLLARLCGYSQI